MEDEDKHEGYAYIGSTLTIGAIFANLLREIFFRPYVSLLLNSIVVISVLGCIFSGDSLFLKNK